MVARVVMCKKSRLTLRQDGFSSQNLCFCRSAYRAGSSAIAAGDAVIGIDLHFAVTFADSANGAAVHAGTAHDAIVGNLESHSKILLKISKLISNNKPLPLL
jgi:hypothetical protein